ncbi:MAG TPA: ABC transporter ATP-binding protein [Gemmatimonadales bacterium]|nr:ABC transporter ATP-binding protein [Gemmatimonadales bacterium]
MIEFELVEKRYGRKEVLAGLSADVPEGLITALVGPNGSGKTTLIKLLLGLARPDAGQILVAGQRLDGSPEYRRRIGWMPQIARFPAHQSGRQLLNAIARLRGEPPTDLSLVDDFGIAADFDRPLGVLSGGTRQKVNAVLALAFSPRLLVLDEPTAGLDPLAARIFKDRLAAERRRGTTVLITSHVVPELEELADHVLFLSDGRAAWQGDTESLKTRTGAPTLERAIARMLGPGLAMEAA